MRKFFITITKVIIILFCIGCGNERKIVSIYLDEGVGYRKEIFVDKNRIFETEYNGDKCYLFIVKYKSILILSSNKHLNIDSTKLILINPETRKEALLGISSFDNDDMVYKDLDSININRYHKIRWEEVMHESEIVLKYISLHSDLVKEFGKIKKIEGDE